MSHFLLVYDRTVGQLMRQQEFATSVDAMQARFSAEAEFRGHPEIEIVALSAASEEDLKRTHGRYFFTLAELADRFG
ncbi:MAG TPA: hypothetical protein VLK58_23210 [Conexibacter sp.]|nr:hypothetical protein [Conexibacter sp.]